MIEFFEKMHNEYSDGKTHANMSIMSGNTHILFDGTHTLTDHENGRKVIAFNSDNDLKQPPDPDYVKNLGKVHFPGTIISIKFRLDKTQTTKVAA